MGDRVCDCIGSPTNAFIGCGNGLSQSNGEALVTSLTLANATVTTIIRNICIAVGMVDLRSNETGCGLNELNEAAQHPPTIPLFGCSLAALRRLL